MSRCIWGAARDRSLPGLEGTRQAGRARTPADQRHRADRGRRGRARAAGRIEFYNILVNFNIIGFYIAFGVPVIGAAMPRLTGKWTPGAFNLGRWGAPITYLASVWIIFETVNVAWPRTQPDQPWYINWASVLTTAVLGGHRRRHLPECVRSIQAPIRSATPFGGAHQELSEPGSRS